MDTNSLQFLPKNRSRENFLTHSEVSIILIPNQGYYKKKKLQMDIFPEHKCKNLQLSNNKSNPTIYKKNCIP